MRFDKILDSVINARLTMGHSGSLVMSRLTMGHSVSLVMFHLQEAANTSTWGKGLNQKYLDKNMKICRKNLCSIRDPVIIAEWVEVFGQADFPGL